MSLAEVLVIALVAVLVIKPEDWPNIIQQLARVAKYVKGHTEKWRAETSDMFDPQALSSRQQRAQQVDDQYKNKTSTDHK